LFIASVLSLNVGLWSSGCATGVTVLGAIDDDEGSGGSGGSGGAATGGSGGSEGGSGGAPNFPCGVDCSTIDAGECQTTSCDEATLKCSIASEADGEACDDGKFCTTGDSCLAGECIGGPQNDCGMAPPACQQVTCNELSENCSTAPGADGTACTASDLCLINASCQAGFCTGGQPKDCFFAPVPDECHIAECDSMSGLCVPVAGHNGDPCNDPNDLCATGKSCAAGACIGGAAKDCSGLSAGCNVGTCDAQSGNCIALPAGEGNPCDDLDNCTSGEICQSGQCTGGTAVNACIDNDGCCPMMCTENNDSDCSCGTNLALTATGKSSGGGNNGTGYGPNNFNDGVSKAACKMSGCSKCFGWVSNLTSASGKWVSLEWPNAVQIGSMYVEANPCSGGAGCYSGGRTVFSGTVQYFSGGQWLDAQPFTGGGGMSGDIKLTFTPKLNTTKIRIYDITAQSGCGQSSNSLIYEWYAYPGANCSPP
jgi:hypothetical protein